MRALGERLDRSSRAASCCAPNAPDPRRFGERVHLSGRSERTRHWRRNSSEKCLIERRNARIPWKNFSSVASRRGERRLFVNVFWISVVRGVPPREPGLRVPRHMLGCKPQAGSLFHVPSEMDTGHARRAPMANHAPLPADAFPRFSVFRQHGFELDFRVPGGRLRGNLAARLFAGTA